MAELEDFLMKVYENEEEQRLVEEEERAKEKAKTAKGWQKKEKPLEEEAHEEES